MTPANEETAQFIARELMNLMLFAAADHVDFEACLKVGTEMFLDEVKSRAMEDARRGGKKG